MPSPKRPFLPFKSPKQLGLALFSTREFWPAVIVFLLAFSSTYLTWFVATTLPITLGWLPTLIFLMGLLLNILLFLLLVLILYGSAKARIHAQTLAKKLEKNKEQMNEQEQVLSSAKDDFVSLASHQLRTPLSTINWYTEMLLHGDAGKLSRQQRNFLLHIYQSSNRLIELVNALLNISRIELGTFAVETKPLKLSLILDGVLKELHPLFTHKELSLKKTYQQKLPLIPIDEKLLRIVFENIVSNAIHYTPEGGTIAIAAHKGPQNDIQITIADTGYGIPVGQQDKIFTKLFRADNVREKDTTGNGLGLHITKAILDQAGCDIWFESQENKGTTFTISLPRHGMKKRDGVKILV